MPAGLGQRTATMHEEDLVEWTTIKGRARIVFHAHNIQKATPEEIWLRHTTSLGCACYEQ